MEIAPVLSQLGVVAEKDDAQRTVDEVASVTHRLVAHVVFDAVDSDVARRAHQLLIFRLKLNVFALLQRFLVGTRVPI